MLPSEKYFKIFLERARKILIEELGIDLKFTVNVLKSAVYTPDSEGSLRKFCFYAIASTINGKRFLCFDPLSTIFYGFVRDAEEATEIVLTREMARRIRHEYGKCYHRMLSELNQLRRDNIELLL